MIIDPQYTKNLVLNLDNNNKVSPSDTSLVVIKRPTFSIPLMPNREVRVHNSTGEGKYINGLFNKHTVDSHLGLSFDNVLTEMIRTNSYTWVLNFLRFGRDLTKYIDFSYMHPDDQEYYYFNFLNTQTIYLLPSFYITVDSVNKTLTFQRTSLQFTKDSVGARLPAVAIRMMFKVPTKMILIEDSYSSEAPTKSVDISSLTTSKLVTTVVDGVNKVFKSIPLDLKLLRLSSYEDIGDKYLEEYYYDESGVIDVFKDSSKRSTGTYLHTSAPRWQLVKEGDNMDLLSYSRYSSTDQINAVYDMFINSSSGTLEYSAITYGGGDIRVALCGLVMLFPENDAEEYSDLPLSPAVVGTVNYYIQTQTDTYLMYSYTFSRDHKVGSIPYIPLLNDTEYVRLNLDGVNPVGRDFVLYTGNTYNFYTYAPYSVTLVHNNRNANTVLRVLNNVLPPISSQTKKVGGGYATFLGYYSSSTGGTQYVNSSTNWVRTPSPGQTLYARWSKELVFSIETRNVYKGENSIEANRNFVPDSAYFSGSQSLWYYTAESIASGSTIGRGLKGSLTLGSDSSYQNPSTYDLSGGYQWYTYSNRLHIRANIKSTIQYISLSGNTLLTVPGVSCSLTKDETNGYTPAKNCILKTEINEVSPNMYVFYLLASNTNSYSVKIQYIVYSAEGVVARSGSTDIPSGSSHNVVSYLVSGTTYKYQVVATQSWDSNAGDNAGKDSVYETVIESYNFDEVILKTATPTVGTPYCTAEESNYLRVSVKNNDSVSAVIKMGSIVLGSVSPGASKGFIVDSGFTIPPNYSYFFIITATATGKTQSDSVTKNGSVSVCNMPV